MKFGEVELSTWSSLIDDVRHHLKEELGFDGWVDCFLKKQSDIWGVYWLAQDKFTQDVHYSERQGYRSQIANSIEFELGDEFDISSLWKGLHSTPGRERRELDWMVFRSAKFGKTFEGLESAAASALQAEWEALMKKADRALEDKSGEN